MEMYSREEFKGYNNILDYIKRKDHGYLIIKKDDNSGVTTFEIIHKTYVNKMVEKLNFETGTTVKRIYLINSIGEMVSVKPDFIGDSIDVVYKGSVDVEKNMVNLTKMHMYLLILNDSNVSPLKLEEEVGVIDRILRNKESIVHIFKVDDRGNISKVDYDFNDNFKVELKRSREWYNIVRDYRRVLKEETKKNRR